MQDPRECVLLKSPGVAHAQTGSAPETGSDRRARAQDDSFVGIRGRGDRVTDGGGTLPFRRVIPMSIQEPMKSLTAPAFFDGRRANRNFGSHLLASAAEARSARG